CCGIRTLRSISRSRRPAARSARTAARSTRSRIEHLRPARGDVAMKAARRLTVVQLVPALNAGGVERSSLEIGTALAAAGHRSIVVSAGGRLVPTLTAQ